MKVSQVVVKTRPHREGKKSYIISALEGRDAFKSSGRRTASTRQRELSHSYTRRSHTILRRSFMVRFRTSSISEGCKPAKTNQTAWLIMLAFEGTASILREITKMMHPARSEKQSTARHACVRYHPSMRDRKNKVQPAHAQDIPPPPTKPNRWPSSKRRKKIS